MKFTRTDASHGIIGVGLLTATLLLGNGTGQAAPAESQADELRALRSQIATLQEQVKDLPSLLERLDKLEAEQKQANATATKAGSPVVAKSKLPIAVSGLVQVQSLSRLSESGPAAGSNDTFRLRRGQIRLDVQATPRISARAMFDIAKTQDANDRPSDEVLQDLYISYLLNQNKGKTQSNFVDVGQYKVPIGYESLVSATSLPFVERALMFQVRDPLRGKYGDGRDTGAQLRGTSGKFDYRAGVFNGFGERQNTTALSDAKAVIGRLGYNVTPDFQIGVSAARGNTGVNAAAERADRSLYNAFAACKRHKFTLQGEYVTGDYSDPTGAIQNIRSYYGNVGYLFTPKLEGVARADFFDFKNLNAELKEYTLGLNYYLKGDNAKIQLNLVRRAGNPAAPGTTFDHDATELRTNFQVAF